MGHEGRGRRSQDEETASSVCGDTRENAQLCFLLDARLEIIGDIRGIEWRLRELLHLCRLGTTSTGRTRAHAMRELRWCKMEAEWVRARIRLLSESKRAAAAA